ncbi:hypothetical protein [Salinibacterium sp. ZJ450]|uniref:hypothetical protein n=1 Tax=Salinibacterium sp. ZJ450 TaxID=2708338 RepID=UPI0014245D74|nr:hypothetical protein [Salinibacterium sp. ZJ450]
MISIAIVDPELHYRSGLSVVLERDRRLTVVIAAASVDELLKSRTRPSVVLLAESITQLTTVTLLRDQYRCAVITVPKKQARKRAETFYGEDARIARTQPLAVLIATVLRVLGGTQ